VEAFMTSLSPAAQDALNSVNEQIEKKKLAIPILPEVARKVLQLVDDPESDALQLSNIIQSDQALAVHILKIANSPAYTPAGNIVSLQQAISRLGMQMMSEVAIAASVNARMFNAPGCEEHIQQIWNHALGTGLWAKEVARLSRKNVEAAFLCGLLHSIGRPMVLQWVSDVGADVSLEEKLQIESELYMKANTAMMAKWQMPELVTQTLGNYDKSLEQLSDSALIVRAGMLLSHWMEGDLSVNPADDPVHGDALPLLNLYPEDVEKLRDKVELVSDSREAMRR
jgi:HD-like signal output (HDOD) protein